MVFCCTQFFGTYTFFILLILVFLSFKKAARGGGVYPDVMFEVAKHWYELYNKNLPAGNAMATPPPGNLLQDIDNKTVRKKKSILSQLSAAMMS